MFCVVELYTVDFMADQEVTIDFSPSIAFANIRDLSYLLDRDKIISLAMVVNIQNQSVYCGKKKTL